MSLNQDDPRVRFNLGWYNMQDGRLYEGQKNLEYGRLLNVFGGAKNINAPIYDGSSLVGKTLLFHGEGGYGDEIINIRFAKNFHELGAKVIVGCSKELFPLFESISSLLGAIYVFNNASKDGIFKFKQRAVFEYIQQTMGSKK
jgi:hypothetical protein